MDRSHYGRQWAAILEIKTPLGHVSIAEPADPKPIQFDISVIDAAGAKTSLINQVARYVLPN